MTVPPASTNDIVAFLDANIVLEGKPLKDLPWTEIATAGLIHVLIVPKAMEEIDAKKRDGRLAPHARAFNRLIAPSVISEKPIVVRDEDPRVELQMATCSRIPWDDYDELDRDDGDSRIVAEVLHVRNVTSQNRLLISHDIKPLVYARGRGLPVYHASDAWLRSPEPSPKDKEIQRLKQKVAEYKKDEPRFEISIDVSDISPATIYRVAALEVERAESLTKLIKRRNPKQPNGSEDPYGIRSGFGSGRDSSYDGKYRAFLTRRVPSFVAKYNEKLELLFNQRLLDVRVSNVGDLRADHLVVSIMTKDGWINDRIVAVSPSGPSAPQPRPDYLGSLDIHRHLGDMIPPRVGRHEFETMLRARRSRETRASCEDFHSGQAYYFEGFIAPTSSDEPLEIVVTLTAKNLRGEHTETFKVEKAIIEIDAGELVDLQTLELKKNYPTQDELARLFQSEDYDEIEWDCANDQ